MAAQRAEFAKLFGSSVEKMVEDKDDNEFWNCTDRMETLIGKCTEVLYSFHILPASITLKYYADPSPSGCQAQIPRSHLHQ